MYKFIYSKSKKYAYFVKYADDNKTIEKCYFKCHCRSYKEFIYIKARLIECIGNEENRN